MEMIVFLAIGIPLALILWLISSIARSTRAIETLEQRLDRSDEVIATLKDELRNLETAFNDAQNSGRAAKESAPASAVPTAAEKLAAAIAAEPDVAAAAEPEDNLANVVSRTELPKPPPLPPVAPPIQPPVLETFSEELPPAPESSPAPEPAAPPFEEATAAASLPEEPAVSKSSLEMRVGKFWLVRIGIVIVLTSLAFFADYEYHNIVPKLGPGGKTALLYLASGLLLGAGAWWQRRAAKVTLKNYAQVLFAGGLAAVYFTTYAAYHVPALRIITNPIVDGLLLLAWAGFIAWLADRRKSEVMALFAIGLAFYSSIITRVGDFTLYSNLVLTITAVFFLIRNRWVNLSFAGLVASYVSYAFWRFLRDDGWRWAQPDERLGFGAAFLLAYWLVFTAATFLSRSEKLEGPARAGFLTLNNGAFFALFLLTMVQVHPGGFWKFALACGAALLVCAGCARKWLPTEPLTKNAYLTQGTLLVTLGFIFKFSGLHLSLVLAAESVVLYITARQRQSMALKAFAYAAAGLATGWDLANLHRFDSAGLWTGAAVGMLMMAGAFWAHRKTMEKAAQPLRLEPSVFTVLAFLNWIATTYFNTAAEYLPLALAGEAVVFTLSIYVLKIREISLLGQFVLMSAAGDGLNYLFNEKVPWWNPLTLIAIVAGISHWWQKQKTLVAEEKAGWFFQMIYAAAAVMVTVLWLPPLMDIPVWLAVSSLLALAATIYGVMTRLWPLAAAAQVFLIISLWHFFIQVWTNKPAWFLPLAPVAVLLILSLATVAWLKRRPDAKAGISQPVLQLAVLYRWVAVAASLCWLWQYVPDRQHSAAFMAAAAALFSLALWKRNQEALLAAAVYAAVAIGALWARDDLKMDVYWLNLLVLLALFGMQQALRRWTGLLAVPAEAHGAVVLTAGATLWRFVSCWASGFTSGFYLTMTWAGLAVLVLLAGILLRERFYRWFGLGVLAAAVGRVIIVDVWQQETVYRILTFLALGVALLVVGFLYNKYEEKIRQWL